MRARQAATSGGRREWSIFPANGCSEAVEGVIVAEEAPRSG